MKSWFCAFALGATLLTAAASPPARAADAPPAPATGTEADAKFADFLKGFRDTAIKAGIDPEIYDRSVAGIHRNPRVETLNLEQPEFVKPVWQYLDTAVSADRIAHGDAMLAANAAALADIETRYGVAKEILVAIWGNESDYGQSMGGFNMFEALATLAYDGPRMDYARRELIDAFRMEQQEHLDPALMTSSWAGAFGEMQFVPSAFLTYAVDQDGDGKRDLWHSPADALASAAALLAAAGWEKGAPWGYEVTLPGGFPYETADLDKTKSLSDWSALGVTAAGGAALPKSPAQAAIYLPAGARGPAFIVFDNFRTVLKYNNAGAYALAVCTLADRLRGAGPIEAAWPRDEMPLTRDERIAFQTDLQKLGYDPGDIDGVLGRKVRAALRAYQKARDLIADGFPTGALLARLERELAAKGN
jgi:membrane-bound lytic murein transglycosylase B